MLPAIRKRLLEELMGHSLFPRAYSRHCRQILTLTRQRHGLWHHGDPCIYFIRACIKRSRVWSFGTHEPLHGLHPEPVTTFTYPSIRNSWLSAPRGGGGRTPGKMVALEADHSPSIFPLPNVSSTRKPCRGDTQLQRELYDLPWPRPSFNVSTTSARLEPSDDGLLVCGTTRQTGVCLDYKPATQASPCDRITKTPNCPKTPPQISVSTLLRGPHKP